MDLSNPLSSPSVLSFFVNMLNIYIYIGISINI